MTLSVLSFFVEIYRLEYCVSNCSRGGSAVVQFAVIIAVDDFRIGGEVWRIG